MCLFLFVFRCFFLVCGFCLLCFLFGVVCFFAVVYPCMCGFVYDFYQLSERHNFNLYTLRYLSNLLCQNCDFY